MKRILVILISILTLSSQTMAYEEANYEVVKENQEYEIRKYSDRLVIETNSIEGNGFRKLFNYISGNNEESQEIKMTVPVTQEIKNGSMTMQFYLPLKFNKDNAPKPSNSDIKILNIEGGYYAVIKYSGRSSDKNFLKNKNILEKQLKQDNITIISPPIRASYNSPFTLPMLKRNEVMYKINL
jgi:DNA gyrase inhibitor GyrI